MERQCDLAGQVLECAPEGWLVVAACPDGCEAGACVCAPKCIGCGGPDGCGGVCECPLGECIDGQCRAACPIEGTGAAIGDVVAAMTLAGPEATWSSHARCQLGSTLLVEVASWCDACVPSVEFAKARGDDVEWFLVLGETQPGTPPSTNDAVAYAAARGVLASRMLLDPAFTTLAASIDHGGGGYPFFIVLDDGRRIRYAGPGGDAPDFEPVAAALSGARP